MRRAGASCRRPKALAAACDAGDEQVNAHCELGLHLHQGATFTIVNVGEPAVAFAAGYEGWDPATELDPCVTDGIIGDDVKDRFVSAFGGSVSVDPCHPLRRTRALA